MSPSLLRSSAALAALIACAPRPAEAAACCGTSYGAGRYLAIAERAAAMITLQGKQAFGGFAADGDYHASPDGVHEREVRGELDWQVRVGARLQLGASAPLVYTSKAAGTLASAGGGVGDVRAYGRVDLLRDGARAYLPGVAAALSVSLPTGTGFRTSVDELGADVTGLGAGEVRPAVLLERTFDGGLHASADASLGLRTAYHQRDGRRVQLAPRWTLVATAGPVFDNGLALSAGVLHEREAEASVGGVDAGGARSRTAVLASASYDVTPRWTAFLSLAGDLPAAGLGANEATFLAANMALRFSWGRGD